jgi:hypothetical protein
MIRLARNILFIGALAVAAARPAAADPADSRQLICQTIDAAAAANGLPVGFLARLLWTESGFRSGATSPAGAAGVAQFMPQTAAAYGLADPRDPLQAIRHAASLLVELDRQFGNLGLAAAAYNAGAARVAKWLQGLSGLPIETRLYVLAITGRPPEDWAAARGNLYATANYPLPGLDCLNATAGPARSGLKSEPRERVWETRLDSHLSAAVALFGAVARSETATQTQTQSDPILTQLWAERHAAAAGSLCAILRSKGARCVFGR